MKYKYGFIGCGNMGGAIVRAVGKLENHGSIFICDHHIEKMQVLAAQCGAKAGSAKEAANSDILFIGVKPKALSAAFSEISDALLKSKPLIISMAAGVSVKEIEKMSGCPVIRIMPNIPAAVGHGVILYSAGDSVSKKQKDEFLLAMKYAGITDEIDEHNIDAASALSGCGPAFVSMFIEALADGAVKCGLPRDKALLYAAATAEGTANYLISKNEHPAVLKDAVCSPGGTTIAGVASLEEKGFRGAVIDAVEASYLKTINKN